LIYSQTYSVITKYCSIFAPRSDRDHK